MNGSRNASVPPHVGLKHSFLGNADPSAALETHIVSEHLGNGVLVFVCIPDNVEMRILTSNPGLFPGLFGLGIRKVARFGRSPLELVFDVLWGGLDPLPRHEH